MLAAVKIQEYVHSDIYYLLALQLIAKIGPVKGRKIWENEQRQFWIDQLEKGKDVFVSKKGKICARDWKTAMQKAEAELSICEYHSIIPIPYTSDKFPVYLKHCADAPLLLFFKGNDEKLAHSKQVAIVGTRNPSNYGREQAEYFAGKLSESDVVIVSGFAYGVDITAHLSAVEKGFCTFAVMGGGFGNIYPTLHKKHLDKIYENGGVMTEFLYHELPDRTNFPQRNRIVAGMTMGTLVIESALKGGSMLTAYLAHGYNREVFTIPGRLGEKSFEGNHALIKRNVSQMVTSPEDILKTFLWDETPKTKQTEMFFQLDEKFNLFTQLFAEKNTWNADEMCLRTNKKLHEIQSLITELELLGHVRTMPGNVYKWCV